LTFDRKDAAFSPLESKRADAANGRLKRRAVGESGSPVFPDLTRENAKPDGANDLRPKSRGGASFRRFESRRVEKNTTKKERGKFNAATLKRKWPKSTITKF
jgi:hypothetical protein